MHVKVLRPPLCFEDGRHCLVSASKLLAAAAAFSPKQACSPSSRSSSGASASTPQLQLLVPPKHSPAASFGHNTCTWRAVGSGLVVVLSASGRRTQHPLGKELPLFYSGGAPSLLLGMSSLSRTRLGLPLSHPTRRREVPGLATPVSGGAIQRPYTQGIEWRSRFSRALLPKEWLLQAVAALRANAAA